MDSLHLPIHSKSDRDERLEARISAELKSILQYAANLQGSSLSEFLIKSASKSANEVIREHLIIKFSTEDSLNFVENILHPKKPNKNLKSAYLQYQKEVLSK